MKTFWKGVALSFARMTPGFWSTFVGLLIHPWVVIREYLRGKRVKYSPPVTMVIQLLLYSTFIYTVLGHILDIDFFSLYSDGKTEEETGNWLLNLILSSDVLFKILIACSIAINCYVAYRNKGGAGIISMNSLRQRFTWDAASRFTTIFSGRWI